MNALFKCIITAAVVFLPQTLCAQAQTSTQVRFPELTPEQLTPEQKKWADAVAAPPRGANFRQPPYRIYMRSPELAERGVVELLGLMGYYDIVAKMLITANAVPPHDPDVPILQPVK